MEKYQDQFTVNPKEVFDPETVKQWGEIKKVADLKQNLLDAVKNENIDNAVMALQYARYFLLELGKIDVENIRESRDSSQVKDGRWKKQFEELFSRMKENLDWRIEVHLDSANRLMVGVEDNKPYISLSPIEQIMKVKQNFQKMENCYDLYYGKDGNPEHSSIEDDLKKYLEENPEK